MSTRIEIYENHAFRLQWKEILSVVDEIETPLEATSDEIQNRARLTKAIAHIDKLILVLDKDLVPPSLWDNCKSAADKVLNHLQANDMKPNAAQIDNANTHLDSLIQYVSPYALTTDKAADAVGAALSAYSSSIDAHTTALEKSTAQTLKEAKGVKVQLETMLVSLEAMEAKVAAYEETLFTDTEDKAGTKSKIEELQSDIGAARDEVLAYRKELIGGEGEEAASISGKINTQRLEITKNRMRATKILEEIEQQRNELETTHKIVMGQATEDGKKSLGLKAIYESSLSQLEDYESEQKIALAALTEEINSLLPGALSAGLATSFADQRRSYEKPIKDFGGLFNWALAGLFFIGFTTMFQWSVGSWPTFALPTELESVLYGTVARAPLILPLVWFAYYAAKRRNEYRRLEEEYAHKETIARSYHGFKQQVEQLEGEDVNKLSARLLEAAIGAVAANASKALDKDHNDGMPIMDKIKEIEQVKDALNAVNG